MSKTTTPPNRVSASIQRIQARVDSLGWSPSVLSEKARGLDLDLDEYVKFQELKSLAFTSGVLTLDEAQLVYSFLGESPETFNKQSYVVKVALTLLFGELMGVR